MRPIARTINQIIRFGAAGIVAMSTNIGVTVTVREGVGLPVEASYLCGFVVVLFVSFISLPPCGVQFESGSSNSPTHLVCRLVSISSWDGTFS